MLKKRDLNDCHALFELMTHPEVFPFVRQKAFSYDEYVFVTKQVIEAEERGELISRTILDDWGTPIGTINLFDIQDLAGFLGTWLGKPFHGKGYNEPAKDAFFQELFFDKNIETVYMRIRKENTRSIKAAEKIPYVVKANETRSGIYHQLNLNGPIFDLYEVSKDQYQFHQRREIAHPIKESQLLEA
ncbi:GNAT family protein [Bacillus sp. B15-48]|uniref:GNAT family N-acetyltransferase n=1 Tax=Bacillus sp. B15-48 TaxID=1548601 RepID=UPI00193F6321|nr:GNAT family protein [Bacillus sp. B15-48]MBM4761992.1 GNAT family N-acetyltransferase [Bacillus sp. B15-48]